MLRKIESAGDELAVKETVDDLTGIITYTVEGPNVTGRVGFYPFLAFDNDTPAKTVLIVSGVSPGGALRRNHLNHHLSINGTEIEFTYAFRPNSRHDESPQLDAYERGDVFWRAQLPAGISATVVGIVEGLIGMWLGRADTGDLLRVASLASARERHQHELSCLRQLTAAMIDLDQELIKAQERAGRFSVEAAEYELIVEAVRNR
jgi:hypothetical protein